MGPFVILDFAYTQAPRGRRAQAIRGSASQKARTNHFLEHGHTRGCNQVLFAKLQSVKSRVDYAWCSGVFQTTISPINDPWYQYARHSVIWVSWTDEYLVEHSV